MKLQKLKRVFVILLIVPALYFAMVSPVWGVEIETIRFERITVEHGLPQNVVESVVQDNQGYIWFGTFAGLCRYDGYSIKTYRHIESVPDSLSYNKGHSLFVDKAGTLWIGTWGGGLNKYDRRNDLFISYKSRPDKPDSLSSNTIYSILEDDDGKIWLGTANGVNEFHPGKESFLAHFPDPKCKEIHGVNRIFDLKKDGQGFLWAATSNGLAQFNKKKREFNVFRIETGKPGAAHFNHIRAVLLDKQGVLWLGTRGGLIRFDRSNSRFIFGAPNRNLGDCGAFNTWIFSLYEDSHGGIWAGTKRGLYRISNDRARWYHYKTEIGNFNSLSNNLIAGIFEDRNGNMWVATSGGVTRFNLFRRKFRYYLVDGKDESVVFPIYEDNKGQLWVGTAGEGLFKYDLTTGKAVPFPKLLDKNVLSIFEDSKNFFWIGTSNGLYRFKPDPYSLEWFKPEPDSPGKLVCGVVFNIFEDSRSNLWISTQEGLHLFDRDAKTFRIYKYEEDNPYSLSYNSVNQVFEDSKGGLWVITYGGGFNKFDPVPGKFTRHKRKPGDKNSLSNNYVYCIHEDRNGIFWIGTDGGGLNKFDPSKNTFENITTVNGLPNNTVFGILEDGVGNLWMNTNKGICRFNPGTLEFRNYDVRDGVMVNEFNTGSFMKSKNGEMFFGGVNGFNAFFPHEIKDNPNIPPVFITGLSVFNQPVEKVLDRNSHALKPINQAGEIVFSYDQNMFTLEFAALNYTMPERNRYKYKLEGFTDDWIDIGNRHEVSFTNLDPGSYTFRVKGSNNDGVWNEAGASIRIIVTPPFWRTLWFRVLILIGMVFLVVRVYKMRLKSFARELEGQTRLDYFFKTHNLSQREQEIVELVFKGKRNKDIEKELYISIKTVKTHIYKIYKKVGVKSRVELINKFQDISSGRLVE